MPAIASSPTAIEPAHPSCTIVVPNPRYLQYVSDRWPYCIVEQSYNISGENFTPPIDASSSTPAPAPTPSSSSEPQYPDNPAAIYGPMTPIFVIAGLFALSSLVIILHVIFQCVQQCVQRRRGRGAGSRPISSARRIGNMRITEHWFGRKPNAPSHRHRTLHNAVRFNPIQRSLDRVLSFRKRSPVVTPLENPRPRPNSAASQHTPVVLPPGYQTAQHLPPPALPVPAPCLSHMGRMRSGPPPVYEDSHMDPVYVSESGNEDNSAFYVAPRASGSEEHQAPAYEFDPWRGATRDG